MSGCENVYLAWGPPALGQGLGVFQNHGETVWEALVLILVGVVVAAGCQCAG